MKTLFTLILVSVFCLPQAWSANVGDPEEVNIQVYGFWASANTACTNPVEVFTDANPTAVNMHGDPTLGTGIIADGTYPCIIIKMNDSITFKPAYNSDGGNCVQGVDATINVFRDGETSSCPDGTTATGTDGEETPCIYIATTGSDTSETPFQASTPFKLQNAWTVSGDTTGTFAVDFYGKVTDNGGSGCDVQAPTWTFR